MRLKTIGLLLPVLFAACGGGSPSNGSAPTPTQPASWVALDQAVDTIQGQFSGGLTVEVLTPAGVVYSYSAGGFSNSQGVMVASASKWVSATILLRLVDRGVLSLDTTTSALLKDANGNPWSGNLGQAKLRHLLSFTTGISGSVPASEDANLTLDQAVQVIYLDQAPKASAPGAYFDYGSTHLRIAARMAEIATGKTWPTIVQDEMGTPLGWPASANFHGTNYDPAGTLYIDGENYVKFLSLQLRKGMYGSQRLLSESLVDQQRADAYGPNTTIQTSPYVGQLGKYYHYGFGNWLETAGGAGPTPGDPVIRWSSTGSFGWAPWVVADGSYAGVIMTRQPQAGSGVYSDNLKVSLDPLIRQALASGTVTVIRSIP
jgi:CubicO group peptidase (beta-lactamase class C family)